MACLWVLNLDAEQELANPTGYVADSGLTARARKSLADAKTKARENLLGPQDCVFEVGCRAEGFEGRAWCPTPSALARLASAGARVPPAPALEVLRRVNDRAFCVDLGLGLSASAYFRDLEPLRLHLQGGEHWLLKRGHSFAGRGQRAVRAQLTDADLNWISARLKYGGIEAVPRVELRGEFSLHAVLHRGGRLQCGPIAKQRVAGGAWVDSQPVADADLTADERASFQAAVEHVATALERAGYFGPFGLDAFRWMDASGSLHWNPCSEINARYSMGWDLDSA